MKRSIYLFIASLVLSNITFASEPAQQQIKIVLEVSNAVINFSPSGQELGRVLVARCPECRTETMTFDQNSLLQIGGEYRPITELGSHTNWSGLITVTNLTPNKIIEFTPY